MVQAVLSRFASEITQDASVLTEMLSRTEEPAKAGSCARDRRALQQLALNVHVKHSDLT